MAKEYTTLLPGFIRGQRLQITSNEGGLEMTTLRGSLVGVKGPDFVAR